MSKRTYIIDGKTFSSPEEAGAAFTRTLELAMPWDGNPDQLPPFLRGGLGTPHDGFILVWKNSAHSRELLGHEVMAQWLKGALADGDPSRTAALEARLAAARNKLGPTFFDALINVVRAHKDIELRLE